MTSARAPADDTDCVVGVENPIQAVRSNAGNDGKRCGLCSPGNAIARAKPTKPVFTFICVIIALISAGVGTYDYLGFYLLGAIDKHCLRSIGFCSSTLSISSIRG